jgi:hypothetical protein
MRAQWIAIVLGLTLVAAATAAAPAASEPQAAAGNLEVVLVLISTSVPCPADAPPKTTECRALTVDLGSDVVSNVRKLGWVSETAYTLPLGLGPPTCPVGLGKPLATTGRLTVVEMGEIAFALSEGARCMGHGSAWLEPQEFTITGGTGLFAGASGSGTLVRQGWGGGGGWIEIWTGTLTAPGLWLLDVPDLPESDVPDLPPKLTGAVAKTVRAAKGAKSARVTFKVTATDDEGADIPVTCWPRSGSRFPLGKTIVLCAATDSSGNWVTVSGNFATASFTVTVKPRR